MFNKVLNHSFFNKRGLADVVMDAKNIDSKAVLFYRRNNKGKFTKEEENKIKVELVKFANMILEECK